LIAAVARRLTLGSFVLRAWSVLVVGALLAVAANSAHERFAWLSLFIAITFWLFDAYLSRQAGLLRKLTEHVRHHAEAGRDVVNPESIFDTRPVEGVRDALSVVVFSPTLLGFYGLLVGAIAAARAFSALTR